MLTQIQVLGFMYSKHMVSPRNIELELQRQGKTRPGYKLTPEDLFPYDQDHFMGQAATELCLKTTEINKNSRVLDIGSGVGGPARYISYKTGCQTEGIEIQEDRIAESVKLTNAVGLEDRVRFTRGDISSVDLPHEHFTHVISFLAILHILEKRMFLKKIGEMLTRGGKVYIEDYYRPRQFDQKEERMLLETVSCPSLLPWGEYLTYLHKGGVHVEKIWDMTEEWGRIATERYTESLKKKDQNIQIYGQDTVEKGEIFCAGVVELYRRGVIGGFRVIGKRL